MFRSTWLRKQYFRHWLSSPIVECLIRNVEVKDSNFIILKNQKKDFFFPS